MTTTPSTFRKRRALLTAGEFARTLWLADHAFSATTRERYAMLVQPFLDAFGELRFDDIPAADLDAWQRTRTTHVLRACRRLWIDALSAGATSRPDPFSA